MSDVVSNYFFFKETLLTCAKALGHHQLKPHKIIEVTPSGLGSRPRPRVRLTLRLTSPRSRLTLRPQVNPKGPTLSLQVKAKAPP